MLYICKEIYTSNYLTFCLLVHVVLSSQLVIKTIHEIRLVDSFHQKYFDEVFPRVIRCLSFAPFTEDISEAIQLCITTQITGTTCYALYVSILYLKL